MQLFLPICKRDIGGKTKRHMVVEIDHEHLVLRIAGAGERQRGGNHIVALRRHATAVIDKNADCNRDIFVAEVLDLLKYSILINLEIVFFEPGNRYVVAIQNGCAEDDHVDINLKGICSVRLFW